MLRLFFRKNLYEGWDFLPQFLIPNLLMDVVVGLLVFLSYCGRSSLGIWIGSLFTGCVFLSIMNMAWAEVSCQLVDYKSAGIKDYFKAIPKCIFDGMFLGIIYFILIVGFGIGFTYYFNAQLVIDPAIQHKPIGLYVSPNMVGMMAGFTFSWIILVISMALSWFPVIKATLHYNFRKTLKRCFVLFFDNLGISIVISLYNLFLSLLSIVLLGVAPGSSALTFARANAFRLLLKKYDYFDEQLKLHPEGLPRNTKVPWKEILKEDDEITGHRTFKNFIMPWKSEQ